MGSASRRPAGRRLTGTLGGMEPIVFVAPILGLLLGTLMITKVGYWLATMVTLVRRHRSSERGDGPISSVGGLLGPVLIHSGPWLLAATVCWAYYVLTAPHAAGWSWFFAGVAAAPILWAPVFWSFRKPRSASASEAASEVGNRPFFKFARWLNVKRNYVLFCIFAGGIPTSLLLSAFFYDAVKAAPKLIVFFLGASMLGSWGVSVVIWDITHAKPWRVPPSKQP